MTVAHLLSSMSSREFTEWMAYYQIEPFGEEIADVRNAISTAAIVNSANGIKRGVKVADFRVMPQEENAPPDAATLYQKFRQSNAFKPRE